MEKDTRQYPVPMDRVKIVDAFWRARLDRNAEEVIPYQWNALNDNIPGAEPSHAVENFRINAGLSAGSFHGMRFQDSDVAKWLEAASYSLISHPNPGLETIIDGLIDVIAAAQQEDGYLNTYYTVANNGERWVDFSHGHELYCAGHLIEAAVAYYIATGKRKLLDVMNKYVDYIDTVMGPEEHKRKVYCGHEEIELALVKMYQTTGNQKHLRLSEYFINVRGKQPCFLTEEDTFGFEFKDKWFALDYHQAHAPVREQAHADGHSVRAMYLYTAMADLVLETGDQSLIEPLKTVWDSVVNRRMYVTGGIGSQAHGERFTTDYDLPNDVAYAETCASIGLVFWAHRMLQFESNGEYADVLERALYNGVLSGISLDGTKYFYVNPLEVFPEAVANRADHKHVEPERIPWFGCACCPPNISRLVASLGQYIYSANDTSGIHVHLYIGNEGIVSLQGQNVKLVQTTNYPWDGKVSVEVFPEESKAFGLSLRIPGWCTQYTITVNGAPVEVTLRNGYAEIDRIWSASDTVELELTLKVERIRSHPEIRENVGKVALQRGPLVYCIEEIDNGKGLAKLTIPSKGKLKALFTEDLFGGSVVIEAEGLRTDASGWTGRLYQAREPESQPVTIKAVPYSMWGNRKPGEMTVWIHENK